MQYKARLIDESGVFCKGFSHMQGSAFHSGADGEN